MLPKTEYTPADHFCRDSLAGKWPIWVVPNTISRLTEEGQHIGPVMIFAKDLYRLIRLLGHKTLAMTTRYAHLQTADLHEAVGIKSGTHSGDSK